MHWADRKFWSPGFMLPMAALGISLLGVGCQMGVDPVFDDAPTSQASKSPEPGQHNQPGDLGGSASQRNNGTSSSSYNRNEFGDGTSRQTGDQEVISEPTSYPLMSFVGRGNLDHRNGSADVVQKISAIMDKSALTVTVQQFSAEGGDNQSDVNDEIETKTGDTVYQRFGRNGSTSGASSLPGESFLIMSKSFEDRRAGKNIGFSITSGDPLPVLVVPAVESRYAELLNSSIRFASTLVTGGKTFSVNTTVSGQKMGTDLFQITVEYLIPEDKAGELYGLLPMARTTDYGIDTANKRINSISTRSVYNDTNNRRARAINIGFQLCKSVQDGRIQNFASCD